MRTSIPHRTVFVFLIVLAAALRLFWLTNQSLWMDEGASLAMTESGTVSGTFTTLWSVSGGDKYQAGYFILLALWRSVFGDSQYSLQFLSVVPGILTPVIIYAATTQVFGKHHAMLSALFIACSAFCVNYSQEVRPYAFLLCLAALQLLVFAPALNSESGSAHRRWVLGIITLIGTMSSIFLLAFAAFLSVSHLFSYRDIRQWLRWWIPSALLSTPALIYYALTPAATNLTIDAVNSSDIPLWQNAVFALYGHLAGQTYGPPLNALRDTENVAGVLENYAGVLSILFLVFWVLSAGVVHQLLIPRKRALATSKCHFFLFLFLVSFAGAAALAQITTINWMPRHSFYVMIALCVLLPIPIQMQAPSSASTKSTVPNVIAITAFCCLILINLASNSNYFFNQTHWRDDYRSTAHYLNEHTDQNDTTILLWGEPHLLAYYGHSDVENLWQLEDLAQIMVGINNAVATSEDVFIVINRESTWLKFSKPLRNLLVGSYNLAPAARFRNFVIYHLADRDEALALNRLTKRY